MLQNQIELLEASLENPPSAAGDALAADLAGRLRATATDAPRAERALATRGLIALSHHDYRVNRLGQANDVLAVAQTLMQDLEPETRVAVLLRRSQFELLVWDVGAALEHSSQAMQIAKDAGLRVAEASVWANYGTALQAAGLVRQADSRFAHALQLLEGIDEPRMRANIWVSRCQLASHLTDADYTAAAHACEQALRFSELAPPRSRDAMVCTALCNSAALAILRNEPEAARRQLAAAAGCRNLGTRPRWLIAVLEAMLAIRQHNGEAERARITDLLTDANAPARAYLIETYSILAAMYTAMGEGQYADEALTRLSIERANALWAALADPQVLAAHPGTGPGSPQLNMAALDMLERLAITAELRDDATGKHCYRVGRLTMLLAQRAGVDADTSRHFDIAARLHDIGKFAIPDAILLKPGRLNAAELRLMRTHTTIGAGLLGKAAGEVLHLATQVARHHHECWDGSGYPDGCAGDAIPLVARLVSLADVYDALTHVRPYKPAWPHDETMAYIRSMRGKQFDPVLTDHFLRMMDEAAADFDRFLAELETGAGDSAYVVAAARMAEALGTESAAAG